ncbi:hypothetical protein [Micromonospora auratinigra]|uniref:Cellulose binding domain-containing protein n=1 Tax=Micromonospora auratinigra TaxID=261654 RepID=A0A1A8ZJ89_9ACTN|nr:hypothetical protein [Micromonospora auratinigra]SBT44119.1 hypothetical protein GA0070611_2572 [Micromonospora auratinigra]
MGIGQERPSEAPRVLSSVPWIVVLLGVGLLTGLLVVAMLSLRRPERPAMPNALDPPIYLPTMGAEPSPPPSDAPVVPVDRSTSPTASPSPTPSAKVSSAAPRASASAGTGAARTGTLAARYQATASGRDSFEARLTVTNGTGDARNWTAELLFTGNVKGLQASSATGVSVSVQGSGVFVLRGTAPLPSGDTATVSMRFTRTGSGDRPGRCTVDGGTCVIG